jgi:hypothetical protein
MTARWAVLSLVAITSLASDDKPCPPPMLVCVGSQEEADRKNAELAEGCHIYAVCDGAVDAADERD